MSVLFSVGLTSIIELIKPCRNGSTYYMSWCHPSGSITIALFSYFCHHFDTSCEKGRQHDMQLELSASQNKGCFLYYSKKQASKVTSIFWESRLLVCNRKQHEICYTRGMYLELREHKSSFLSFFLLRESVNAVPYIMLQIMHLSFSHLCKLQCSTYPESCGWTWPCENHLFDRGIPLPDQ